MVAPGAVARAVDVLRHGGLVAFPTETVYGLGADASNAVAVRRIFAVKGRPPSHPVIVHLGSVEELDEVAVQVPAAARRLAAACWPGPLTLVVRRRPGRVADEVTGGRETVGVRVPDHPLALDLLVTFGGGVAAPSANRFGRVSPTTAAAVRAELGAEVDLVLDGGPCRVGVESTIVDCTGDELVVLRVGGVTEERLAELLGHRPPRRTGGEVAAPGTLPSHYAPAARVVLVEPGDVADARARAMASMGEGRRVGVLALASLRLQVAGATALAPPVDEREYARVLYARLREADAAGVDVLVVVPPEPTGIGAAVLDRLQRAAAR